ncbi:pantoate--beta-alanine ligase [Proteiniphilum sp. UBA1028]|uniref:pantoate--beta-alanine ligase n=1 Tax=Proteiniphilum sp. UBA1028 TaxID=1947251 RepID=UPI0025E13251|nr:pantoate--beta-alanine ligase [Proteiniphilum sp. UBA1028]
MEIIRTVSQLEEVLQGGRRKGKTIGFVPTMGALHEGHATLVKLCASENDVCVVSLFVNPTQFNNKEDLRRYPRTLDEDCRLLELIGADVVFAPSEEEMYPQPDTRIFDFGLLDKVMEGRYRPGHFNGVAQVVSKLFAMVEPDRAYFGEKDFQQLAIVRAMVDQLQMPVQIVGVPIVREPGGLALSSRNRLLTEQQKADAAHIYRVLRESTQRIEIASPDKLTDWVIDQINGVPSLRVEYFEIVDGDSLQLVASWDDSGYALGCIAVFCGDVRLIDNIRYK